MIRIETKTKLSPEEAIKRAVEFFGPMGHGLEVKDQGPECAYLEGGGGSITVIACAEKGVTRVELLSREWDYQAKEFISRIGR